MTDKQKDKYIKELEKQLNRRDAFIFELLSQLRHLSEYNLYLKGFWWVVILNNFRNWIGIGRADKWAEVQKRLRFQQTK